MEAIGVENALENSLEYEWVRENIARKREAGTQLTVLSREVTA